MTTQFIGLKDFRQNLATYTKKARAKQIRYVILKKNIPVLAVTPLDDKDATLEKLMADIATARQQVKRGQVHTQEEIMKEFGLL